MAEVDKKNFHDHKVQEDMFHDCAKIRVHAKQSEEVTIAAKYFPMSFAEDTSSNVLSSSLTVDLHDIQHTNDNNDNDDDIINSDDMITSSSQLASTDQAPAIATGRTRWNRLRHIYLVTVEKVTNWFHLVRELVHQSHV